jgi:hypothetical protein
MKLLGMDGWIHETVSNAYSSFTTIIELFTS